MSNGSVLMVLLLSALFEAGGDAMVRNGLHSGSSAIRILWVVAGTAVLLAYGVTVNLPQWDFGRVLGVYVTLFFVVAQLINAFAFGKPPTLSTIVGGAMIVAGGLTMTFWT